MISPLRIGEPLVFVDHVEMGVPGILLGFQRGYDQRGVGLMRAVACGEADFPTAMRPLGKFVIRQSAGGDSVDHLAGFAGLLEILLKDKGLARTRWRLNHDIATLDQRPDGSLLPGIGQLEILELSEGVQGFSFLVTGFSFQLETRN
jgi:hypothetical protein